MARDRRHLVAQALAAAGGHQHQRVTVGAHTDEAATRPLRQAFAAALEMFQKRQWPAAQTAFEKLLESFPQDGPTQFYLKHLAELRGQPVPENWTGDVELKEK